MTTGTDRWRLDRIRKKLTRRWSIRSRSVWSQKNWSSTPRRRLTEDVGLRNDSRSLPPICNETGGPRVWCSMSSLYVPGALGLLSGLLRAPLSHVKSGTRLRFYSLIRPLSPFSPRPTFLSDVPVSSSPLRWELAPRLIHPKRRSKVSLRRTQDYTVHRRFL